MLIDVLGKLGFSPAQKKIFVKVMKVSVAACITVVAGAWLFQTAMLKVKAHEKKRADMVSASEKLAEFYDKKSRDLLPVDVDAHEFVAKYYIKNDQPEKAIEHILRIMPLQKTNRSLALELATAYLESGHYNEALEEFVKLESSDTSDCYSSAIEARAGLTLFYLGEINESINKLDTCIAKYPRSAEALCYRGQVEAATDTVLSHADDYFRRSLETDPGYNEALYQRARLCMTRGNYAESRQYLMKILEREPLDVKAHARLGMVYYYLDEPEFAKKSYQTALALNPGDYNTHYNLGELYFTKYDDKAMAMEEFKKTLEGNSAHGEANFKAGIICLGNNMVKEAVMYLERARQASPDNVRILLQLGVAYERLDMKDEALDLYRRVLSIDELNKVAKQKVDMLTNN
jgi:tetratricopeptide (TPR) repeat protein